MDLWLVYNWFLGKEARSKEASKQAFWSQFFERFWTLSNGVFECCNGVFKCFESF